jgi:hypothetical protein
MSIFTNILTGGTNNHETTSENANAPATDFIRDGFIGTLGNTVGVAPATGAYAVNAQGTPDMTVAVSPGVAYITATPTGQGSQKLRARSTQSENVTINANSTGSTRYDWIYLRVDADNAADPATDASDVTDLYVSRSTSSGSDNGTPPTFGLLIAVVTVANAASSITNGNISDRRVNIKMAGNSVDFTALDAGTIAPASGWLDGALPAPNIVTYNGNRSYNLVFNGTDLTDTVSEGMRIRTTRTVSAPSQCADLERDNSQYFSKTSPAGLSFTTTFTCSAWVKLESYAVGGIIARRNADTEGWDLSVEPDGRVTIRGLRIASNNKSITSYQSIPLNKWVHVAACINMTAGDTSAQKIWIDGVEVPRAYTLTGTATALVQGTTALVVGARKSAGTDLFDGKIAQASVHSACLSDAQVKALMSQTISSSSPSIVSGFTLSNSLVDVNTTNANNLTAQNSALATNVDSPFGSYLGGTLDYGIITKTAFSTNTTLTVQVPEGCTIPTSGGVSAVSYSTQAVPYLFPRDSGRWEVSLLLKVASSQASPVANTWYNLGFYITAPTGAWTFSYEATYNVQHASICTQHVTISTTNNSETDVETSSRVQGNTVTALIGQMQRTFNYDVTSPTVYYWNARTTQATTTTIQLDNSTSPSKLTLTPAYL